MNEPSDSGTDALERELVVAMHEFADSSPAPAYDARRWTAARRRAPQLWALAAVVVAVAAIGTGLALLPGSGSPRPIAAPVAHPSASTASPTSPAGALDGYAAQRLALRSVVTAAELYENPATRGTVKLGQVEARFTDRAAFTRAWGNGGLGVTCGAVASGALSSDERNVLLYTGAIPLPRHATFAFDPATHKVTGVTCGTGSTGHGDQTVVAFYGAQVSGGKSGDGLLGPAVTGTGTCGQDQAKTWFADTPGAGAGLVTWQVGLDGGKPFTVGIDRTGLISQVTCPA